MAIKHKANGHLKKAHIEWALAFKAFRIFSSKMQMFLTSRLGNVEYLIDR